MSPIPVMWHGAFLDPSGYGEASRNYVLALRPYAADLAVKIRPRYFWNGPQVDLGDRLNPLLAMGEVEMDYDSPYVSVHHLTPENWKIAVGNCKWQIGITTFETDRLPAGWQLPMRAMDELWTFSHWGADVFRQAGIRRPITVIPHGVDTDLFRPEGEKLVNFRLDSQDVYVFGSNFDWTERKNPRALLTAYFSSFKPTDPVVLLLKVYYQYPIEQSRGRIKDYIHEIKHQMGLTQTPPVVLLTDILPSSSLPDFYRSLDAYVLPSCGEGWGLTFSEAMATGLPTIGVNWSGNTEFMNDTNSVLVKDHQLEEVSPADAGAQRQYVGCRWAKRNVEELGQRMRWLFEHPAQGQAIGKLGRETMVHSFTWQHAAQLVHARLKELGFQF